MVEVLRGRVVVPGSVLEDGLVVVDGDRLAWVGLAIGAPDGVAVPAEPTEPGGPRTYLPGLVDVHCHGGGGASFPDSPDVATARRAAAEHLRHGTTSLVASLVTADEATLLARTATLADLADEGWLAGIHLEGPYLSPARCGAQDPALMTAGRPDAVRRGYQMSGSSACLRSSTESSASVRAESSRSSPTSPTRSTPSRRASVR